jgi:hypothetical protein
MPQLRIEFARAARDTRVWLGDEEITKRVVSVTVVADASDHSNLTRVSLACLTEKGDILDFALPMNVDFGAKE